MKTKEEIQSDIIKLLRDHFDSFKKSQDQNYDTYETEKESADELYTYMQQYSDQNTKPLIECLKEVKRIEDLKLFNESEKLEAIKQAVDLTISQYDKF